MKSHCVFKIIIAFLLVLYKIAISQSDFSSSSSNISSTQFIPGIYYKYFHGTWTKLPVFNDEKPVASGIINNFDISNRQQDDHFAFQFQGYIHISRAGKYQFYLKSDDGAKLFINGKSIVDNDNMHVARERSGSVQLSEGVHSIELHYFEREGRQVLELRYSGPGIKKTKIPDQVLFREQIAGFPMPWQNEDIGRVSIGGSAFYNNGKFIVKASGDDIWGDDDEFHFVYWPMNADVEIIAKINSITDTDDWAKSGIMIRESLKDDSKHAFMLVTPDEGSAFQRRIIDKKNSYHSGSSGSVPIWLKLERIGNTFTGYKSKDSLNWIRVGTEQIKMEDETYAGIALTSHDDRKLCTSNVLIYLSGVYDDIILTPEFPVLPADGKSTVSIKSDPLYGFKGTIVPQGTPVTVTTDMGKIISIDKNTEISGVQVMTDEQGQISFEYQAANEPGIAKVFAKSVFGDASGETTVELLGENIQLVSTNSDVTELSQGQKNIPVSMRIRNEGVMTSHLSDADLIISGTGSISARNHFDVQRTDTLSIVRPAQSAELTFIVSAHPDADTVTYSIDGRLVTEIGTYTNCLHQHQWQVESTPALRIESIDAFADDIFQGQDGLIVTMEVVNNGMATVDSVDAGLTFWRQGNDISLEYQVTLSEDTPQIIDGHSKITIMFLVNVSTSATLDTIDIIGHLSGVDVNSGIKYHADSDDAIDRWLVKRAEGILFQAIDVSHKYAIIGQQEPWTIRTHVRNVSGVDLELDSVQVKFNIFNEDVTDEYNFIYPETFLGTQTVAFNNEAEDSLQIHVNSFGASAGLLEITIFIYCHARDFHFTVNDSSPRGLGYIFIYGPPELQISTEIDSCFHITENGDGLVNLDQSFAVKVLVRNIGDEELSNVGVTILSNEECISISDTSQIASSVLKNRSATLFYNYIAQANLVPAVEYFNVRVDSAFGSKSGEPAKINPLSDMNARVTIFRPAELHITADSLIETPTDKIFPVDVTVINPNGHAQCDSSGELTIKLPDGYFIRGENLTKRFLPNKSISWNVRSPSNAVETDSILIFISRRSYDVNMLTPAIVGTDSIFVKVNTLESFVNIKNVTINSPNGARDDTLSTGQTFQVSAIIGQQMAANINAVMDIPPGYSIVSSEKIDDDTLLCTWTLTAPNYPHYQPEMFILNASGNLVTDTTKIVGIPDSSLSVVTVNRANLTVEAEIIDPPKAVEGQVQPDMEFVICGYVKNNGDASIYGTGSLRLDIEDQTHFQIIGPDVLPASEDSVTWTIRTAAELPQDNWVLKVRLQDIPEDINTNSDAFVEKDYKDIAVTSASGGVGRLELMIRKIPDIAQTSIVAGETKILLGITCTNLSVDNEIPILLHSFKCDTYGENGDLIYPFQTMSEIRIVNSRKQVVAQSTEIYANPVTIEFHIPDTIKAQQSDSLFFEIDFNEQLDRRFKIYIKDSSYVRATSIVDVYMVNGLGNSHGNLDISSNCPVIIQRNLKKSFRCYPNPFGSSNRSSTNFVYYLDQNTAVQLKIFTLLGELVWEASFREDEPQAKKGLHASDDIRWDAKNMRGKEVLNGVYIACIRTGDGKTAITKVAVLK